MDLSFDYNSLSERFSKVENELYETKKKLNVFRQSFVSSGFKRPITISAKKDASSSKRSSDESSSESEESSFENDHPSKKVALHSAVIAKVESSKTRKKIIAVYNSDNKVQLRNRRFLGMVQNTLQKFQAEEVEREHQDSKQKKAIAKVEAAVEDEKRSLNRQKAELHSKTLKQLKELQCLKKMMRIAKSFEVWENNQKDTLNFIKTKTRPRIFFLPVFHSPSTKERLERTKLKTIGKIEQQRAFVEDILNKIKLTYEFSNPAESTDDTPPAPEGHDSDTHSAIKDYVNEETKDCEEILHLDLSENELDFC